MRNFRNWAVSSVLKSNLSGDQYRVDLIVELDCLRMWITLPAGEKRRLVKPCALSDKGESVLPSIETRNLAVRAVHAGNGQVVQQ